MHNLLAATAERVYFKDLLSRFLFVSAGWIQAYAPDLDESQIIGRSDIDFFSEQHAAAALADEQRIIRTGEPMVGNLAYETYKDRPFAWVATTKLPLRDADGEIIGTFGISRDITAQIKAEKALERQAKRLKAQNERLLELDRMKDGFISSVSHELRTPLASIIGYVELLKEEDGKGPGTAHFVDVIGRNAKRLLQLVADLLFLSGIQAGEMEMEFENVDLADLAASAVDEVQVEAERKNISLSLTASPVPRTTADPSRIVQVVENLVSNAVKFTPPGGNVDVRLGREDGEAVVAVTDNGIGIPAADMKSIFERFFRSESASKSAVAGTGLGLTISKAIADAHGGRITVNSQEGRGSTFKFHLPLRPPAGNGDDGALLVG